MRIIGRITNGLLPPYARDALVKALHACEGRFVTIDVKRGSNRSLKQNAYYWGVVVPIVQDMFTQSGGVHCDSEQAHDYLKLMFAPKQELTTMHGNKITVARSTTDLNTAEFNDYVTAITAWAAGFGFIIPSPKELDECK